MGLAARVVTRSGRARPVCDSGRGSRTGEPRGTRRTALGSRRRLGATARGRGGCGRCQEPPRAREARDAEVWLAGAAGSTGTGRGAGGCGALSRPRVVCGARSVPQLHSLSPRLAGDSRQANFLPAEPRQRLGAAGGAAAKRCLFPFTSRGSRGEKDGGAGAERRGPRE